MCQCADLEQAWAPLYETATAWAEQREESSARQNITQVVVLDAQRQPLGAIPLSNLLQYTINPGDQPTVVVLGSLLVPLQCLPASTSLQQFWSHLQAPSPEQPLLWGITDRDTGYFLGLVDLPRLLPALAQRNLATHGELPAQTIHLTLERQRQTELLAEISHELKNPLTALLGLLNVFQHSHLGALTGRQRHYLEMIHQKSDQLTAIVKEVLLLSEAQDQRLTLQPDVVEVREICEKAVAIATPPTKAPDLETYPAIQLDIDEQIPALIADRNHLQHILVALLRHHGSMHRPIRLVVKPLGGWIRFTVSVTEALTSAQGSIQLELERGYSPSVQSLHQSVAHHLAHLHHGTLTASRSTETSLIIPPNLAAIPTDPQLIKQLSERLVVIVTADQSATDRSALAQIMTALTKGLNALGYQVVVTQAGLEAIAAINQLQPAVVFLTQASLQPLLQQLLTLLQHRSNKTPIVVVGDAAQPQVEQTGVQHVLTLPITNEAVSQCLDQCLRSSKAVPKNGQLKTSNGTSNHVPPTLLASSRLTILHLETTAQGAHPTRVTTLSQRLNLQGCQVVAIETLEEAELLLPIWKPRVMLYTSPDPAPLRHLDQASPLFKLPFVIVDATVATQAHQLEHVTVYECAELLPSGLSLSEADLAVLVEVLQTAAGKTAAVGKAVHG